MRDLVWVRLLSWERMCFEDLMKICNEVNLRLTVDVRGIVKSDSTDRKLLSGKKRI
jgi:hypothetical protein